jgi:energy-coupling factor transporter ATP-binding protein EcfA2
MINRARQLPTTHLSIRVPWHDSGWNGSVCTHPRGNTDCLILPRIAETRDDEWESAPGVAGQGWDREGTRLPACAAERGAFMAPFAYTRWVDHPYSHNDLYSHFRRTPFQHPAYSLAAVPFAWMMKDRDGIPAKATELSLKFNPELEPDLSFDKTWVQERRNQLAMLDTFFGAIKPEESLVFCYAKRTPLTEDPRRVIVGIGRVANVGPAIEYQYKQGASGDALRCVLWERNIHHSIRGEKADGFLLPYHELLERAAADNGIDLADLVLHAPADAWSAFSMGAEHVSHDQAIDVLIACAGLLERYEALLPGDWRTPRAWVDEQLNRIWRLRGAYPGLGSALTAAGLSHGTLIAHAVGRLLATEKVPELVDPWPLIDRIIEDPKLLPGELGQSIGESTAQLWKGLKPDRRALLHLLARFEITNDQATRWFVPEERSRAGLDLTDGNILENPYVLYEADRTQVDPIRLGVVDRGLFPDGAIATAHPVPAPSKCPEPIDRRRGRAFCVAALEAAAQSGHTLLPQSWMVQRVRDWAIEPPCHIGSDWIGTFSDHLRERLEPVTLANQSPGWQLQELKHARELIDLRVRRRIAAKRHPGDHDWRGLIDAELPAFGEAPDPKTEEAARQEKAVALEEIFRSRISVLIGPAGTGKTKLLSALLSMLSVKQGGVLLLAPTGKARVQLQKGSEAQAFTLAQFLLGLGRYNAQTGAYRATLGPKKENGYKTVIIDECSMLTEEQLAATFDAIDPAAVERLILVGDPRQLPPIGAGRPFVDLVRLLREQPASNTGVPHGFAELKIVRRQTDMGPIARDDTVFARWFGGDSPDPGADEVWSRLEAGTAVGITAVQWGDEADLKEKLLAALTAEVHNLAQQRGVSGVPDDVAFEVSLGGSVFGQGVYFQPQFNKNGDLGSGASAEAWQMLSPIRSGETGVDGVNRWIQKLFRERARGLAVSPPDKPWERKTCKPLGSQGILYGDKVINVANGAREDVYPEKDRAYLANGEIGIVVGQYKGKSWKPKRLPWKLEVEFSTQPGYKYGFSEWEFGQDGDARLELAYALTIHKSQGSEFGTTFVIVPNPCRLLSRELLYTALTRQRNKVMLFHQGELRDLIKLSGPEYAESVRRLTNLFRPADPKEYAGTFLEEGLVHRTARGELVRSKSEVIIANILHGLGVPYSYEQPFVGADGTTRYPDFTIDDAESGKRLYLEHLGMLHDPAYERRWAEKLKWYRDQGIKLVDEDTGDADLLMTTTEQGGIDSACIEEKLRSVLML